MDMNGILQKFIHPYGEHNGKIINNANDKLELIQAIWSPRLCVFTKRVNLRRLNETHFDVYERALTFDGPTFYSKNGYIFFEKQPDMISPFERRIYPRKAARNL